MEKGKRKEVRERERMNSFHWTHKIQSQCNHSNVNIFTHLSSYLPCFYWMMKEVKEKREKKKKYLHGIICKLPQCRSTTRRYCKWREINRERIECELNRRASGGGTLDTFIIFKSGCYYYYYYMCIELRVHNIRCYSPVTIQHCLLAYIHSFIHSQSQLAPLAHTHTINRLIPVDRDIIKLNHHKWRNKRQ